jgi:hypothetical protein
VNASEHKVSIAHELTKSQICRGDACHHPDTQGLWQNAMAGQIRAMAGRTQAFAGRTRATLPARCVSWVKIGFAPTKIVSWLFAFVLLVACAPARVTPNPGVASQSGVVSLAVNPNGDAMCVGANATSVAFFPRAAIRGLTGHDWVAAPTRVSAVAWVEDAWWFALPRAGLVQTALGVPKSIAVSGQPTRLSSRHILTLEGDVLNFTGSRVTRFSALPSSVLELPKQTFFLVGKEVFGLQDGRVARVKELDATNYSLLPENDSFAAVKGVAVRNADYTFILEKQQVRISRNDLNAFRTITLPAIGSSIAVGGDTLAVAIGSSVAFYDARTFQPLLTRACEVTR